MTLGWQIFVLAFLIATFVAHFIFVGWTSTYRKADNVGEETTTGHTWDGDIREYNKPLPRWWLILFHGTVVFAIAYIILYPGSGVYQGVLGWSQVAQYEAEVASAEERFGAVFSQLAEQDIETLAQSPAALSAGLNLFGNRCAMCHGSDARGAVGFPNLTDDAWLYGGEPAQIETTLLHGRQGVMPAWSAPLGGDEGVDAMANYVRALGGLEHDAAQAAAGQAKYMLFCVACHGPQGKGNPMLGAPDLTDSSSLYGSSMEAIRLTLNEGRNGKMPGFGDTLGPDRVKVLAAYVYSLSNHETP